MKVHLPRVSDLLLTMSIYLLRSALVRKRVSAGGGAFSSGLRVDKEYKEPWVGFKPDFSLDFHELNFPLP